MALGGSSMPCSSARHSVRTRVAYSYVALYYRVWVSIVRLTKKKEKLTGLPNWVHLNDLPPVASLYRASIH